MTRLRVGWRGRAPALAPAIGARDLAAARRWGGATPADRAGLEWLLGFRLRGAVLHLDPCIPRAWRRFEITFRYHATSYVITVENPNGVSRGIATVETDGTALPSGPASLALVDDAATHRVRVVLG